MLHKTERAMKALRDRNEELGIKTVADADKMTAEDWQQAAAAGGRIELPHVPTIIDPQGESALELALDLPHISGRTVFHLDQHLSGHKVLPESLINFIHFILVVVRYDLRERWHRHCTQQQRQA